MTIWCYEKDEKVECGGTLSNAHTHSYTNTQRQVQRGKGRQGERTNREKYLRTCTSILRPSTTVPCNFSLALSASTLCSNVTNPKPYMQDRERQKQHARYFSFHFIFDNTINNKLILKQLKKWRYIYRGQHISRADIFCCLLYCLLFFGCS